MKPSSQLSSEDRRVRERVIGLLGRLRERNVRFMSHRLRERGYPGLTPSHGSIVSALRARGSLSMSELAAIIEKRKPTVTVLVRKLAQHELVERVADTTDSRVTRVQLTAGGRKFARVVNEIAREAVGKATRGILPHKQAIFMDVLQGLLDNFDDYK